MAKKTRKSGRKTTTRTARRAGAPKKAAKKPAKKTARRAGGAAAAPKPVKTGRGPTPAEIGRDFVERFNRGEYRTLEERYWSPRITSVEGVGVSLAWNGRRAVEAKNRAWSANNIIHNTVAEGPYVGATGFAMKMRMEVEERATGKRVLMEEVGVYTVQNGKVVREEFMYGSMRPVDAPPAEERTSAVEASGQPEAVEAMGAF